MDQTQREPTFDESVKQVMRTLPPPIRQYLAQGKYSVVAGNLMAKYSLHVDQGGILEREIMLLLMGIENPDEFTQALAGEAKLDQGTINSIVQDVNAQIFVPLREEMRRGPVPAAQPTRPPAPVNAQVPRYAPPPQPQKHFQLQNKIPPPAPSVQSPASRLLEDHEEPHIEFRTAPPPASRPVPPPNLPGAMPPPAPPTQPRYVPLAPPARPPTRPPYSTDPYREPIDTP